MFIDYADFCFYDELRYPLSKNQKFIAFVATGIALEKGAIRFFRKMSTLLTSRQKQNLLYKERFQSDLGELIGDLLNRPNIVEVARNAAGQIWAEDENGFRQVGTMDDNTAESLINVVASLVNASITREKPLLECELPFYGCRFAASIPPISETPTFNIRKKAERIFTLDDYLEKGILTGQQASQLREWILARKNILVAGGTGSGKTTLVNALIDAIVTLTPEHWLVILEDTLELQCKADKAVILRTNEDKTMQQLVKHTLRRRPDRILVGEVRGKEALDLLKAWSTGHPGGVATVHANSAEASLSRLEQLVEEATQTPMRTLIAQAVDCIVYIEKTATGRQVRELLSVVGFKNGEYQLESVP